jgi:peptidyl-prolyl cis-trans isomerase SurA
MYEKQKMMVDASHILIRVVPAAPPADTLRAYEKLQAVRDYIATGADFGDMAVRHSEDPSASNESGGAGYRGRLGYIRGGRLVPEFEDVAFSMPEAEISHVFRTQFGYHILVVHDRAPAAPDIRIAHIMVTPESPEDSTRAWEEILAVHDSLAMGADFAELARIHSDDRSSATAGGDLGFVTIDGRLLPTIKDVAFSLQEIGEVSAPVLTNFGIHLVKLLERKEPETLEDAYEAIRRRVSRSGQMERKEAEFARSILSGIGYSMDTTAVRGMFRSLSGDSAAAVVATGKLIEDDYSRVVVSIAGTDYQSSDLVTWAQSASIPPSSDASDYAMAIADGFVVQKAIDHKVEQPDQENEEFRQTMEDFEDGLLLFRVMEDSVWSRATSDSTELARRYELDPDRYRHPDRTRLLGFYSRQRALADSVVTLLTNSTAVQDVLPFLADSAGTPVRLDTTFVAGPTNSVFDRALDLEPGGWTTPLAYNRGHIVIVNAGIEPARTKTFDEARTEIVNEYQADLEERLIGKLRSRYGAQTFPDRLHQAFSKEKAEYTESASGDTEI